MLDRLRETIRVILDHDPAARSTLEVVLCYPGFHAQAFHQVAHGLWQRDCKLLARMVSHTSRWLTGIEIHPGATLGRRVFIDHGMGTVIGETTVVGDDCTLYQGVTLGGVSLNEGKRHPTLEAGVIVGAGAKVLGGFTVGAGARIGSNAVVIKEVPAGATMVANVAREVDKTRDKARAEQAQKMGFSAYGISGDMADPLVQAIHGLLDHSMATDRKLESLLARLEKMGVDCTEERAQPDAFDPGYLNRIVE
ncbi:serine O-acetyltransferase [Amantichitinum ursilacus]|uniref:Serine acetyltransferase n=1 Tax=Amantichitinum ursilacus TaxID=857265 RepID=A0A0N0XIW4_9NEIS|nr:serine O-acetyltransferase [Amantichitinum ursilacus]KPC53242.1 Serine acetyltransferase [Amantichitinum ursilacus]